MTDNPHSKTGNQAQDLCDQAKRTGRTIHIEMVKETINDDGEKELVVSDTHEKRLTWKPRSEIDTAVDDTGYNIIEENLFEGEVTYREVLMPGEAKKLVKNNKVSLED